MKENSSKWFNSLSALWLALFVVAKLLLFNYYAYHPVWVGLFEKFAVGCFIASFAFLFKDKRWMIPFLLFVDVWCISNLVYVRSNNLILDGFALTMAGGMNGFWDSILIFFQLQDLLFVLLTCVAICPFFFVKAPQREPANFVWALAISVVCNYAGVEYLKKGFAWDVYSRTPREAIYGNKLLDEACRTSIMHTLVYVPLDYRALLRGVYPETLPLSEEQQAILDEKQQGSQEAVTDKPVLVLLVESLESWVINAYAMPNLHRFLSNEHVLYAPRVECQTIGAESADGQMIVLTGILPAHEGATCFRFPHNTYPSLLKANKNNSLILLPHDETVWNQKEMTPAYGFDSTAFISPVDSILFGQLDSIIDAGHKAIFCITMSTHSPFKGGAMSSLELPKDLPYGMYNYVRGFNVVDEGMKQFLDKIETDSVLQQFTIVITGDHTIFHKERRELFARYTAKHADFPFQVDEGYVPMIIYSPAITRTTRIEEVCYQMDIYPTTMHLLGADSYYWQGWGANVLDSLARTNRPFSEETVFDLSDRAIMNDRFAGCRDSLDE